MRQSLRRSDTQGRLGGDEFAVLLEDVADETAVSEVVEHLLAVIAQLRQCNRRHVQHRALHRTRDGAGIGHVIADIAAAVAAGE